MADFCKGCSIREFGEDYRDFAGISPDPIEVLCEGCGGYITVNSDGQKVSMGQALPVSSFDGG